MWHFRENQRSEIIRDQHLAEFFDLEENLEAIVREAVQNSIDAKSESSELVKVRFVYGRTPSRLPSLFLGMQEHLKEVKISAPDLGNSSFEFLAIEDFGTTGLTGSTSKEAIDAESGNFFNFWWFDGSTRKGIQKGGRWGIGKYSFFEASILKTFWGISVAEPDLKPNLMGRVLLKSHKIENRRFASDGIYSDDNFEPIEDLDAINSFYSSFNLKRDHSAGLSLVMPYPVDSISRSDHISEDILTTVLEHYLLSIVSGELKIAIDNFNSDRHSDYNVDKENLEDFLKSMARRDIRYSRYEKLRSIYQRLLARKPDLTLSFDANKPLEIDESIFGSDLNRVRAIYSDLGKELMKVRIQFAIQKEGIPPETTYIDIGITRDNFFKNESVHCFRSGINVVEGVTYRLAEGIIVLIAEDKVAAGFLGDAENPSHTRWSSKSERVKDAHYLTPEKIIRFVKSAPSSVISVLSRKTETSDRNLLEDVFYIFDSDGGGGRKTRTGKPKLDIPKPRQVLQLIKFGDGFSVSAGKDAVVSDFPMSINLRAAYDTAIGNPYSFYRPFDFAFGRDIDVKNISGGEILSATLNRMAIRVDEPGFNFSVIGFDPRRDIIVDLKAENPEEA